jgi:hypothetical protein
VGGILDPGTGRNFRNSEADRRIPAMDGTQAEDRPDRITLFGESSATKSPGFLTKIRNFFLPRPVAQFLAKPED